MSAFFILPFKPAEWETSKSDLQIDPERYRKQLEETWPKVEFSGNTPTYYVLFWGLPFQSEESIIYMGLQKNLQIVSMDEVHPEYILWHRKIIPAKYPLYLNELGQNPDDILELTGQTTFDDIVKFTGIVLD